MIRLDRFLSTLGLGSRSEVQKQIRSGAVMVSGRTVCNPGERVNERAELAVNGLLLDSRLERHIMLNKPADVLTAARDPRQTAVMDILPPVFLSLGCMPVGRLDRDTTGLLLLTTDGEMSHRLLSPARHVDKIYYAEVDGPLNETDCIAFRQGLDLGDFTAAPSELEILKSSAEKSAARVTVHEGKFHQVKRMFEAVGRTVTSLRRERFGPLVLPDDLQEGQWRDLTRDELTALRQCVFMEDVP